MEKDDRLSAIKEKINSHPDFPKKGILFRDFLPVLRYPVLLEDIISLFVEHLLENSIEIDTVVGLEARGFILGPLLAIRLGVPFVPVRKPGKLPGNVVKQTYTLEYGQDAMEMQQDSIGKGCRVAIIDDLIATGGSMAATEKLIISVGGVVESCLSVIELKDLKGANLISAPLYSLIQY